MILFVDTSAQKIADIQFTKTAPKIDAYNNDACWANAMVLDSFTQIQPIPYAPSKYETRIKLCYDNNAIYVFGEMLQPDSTILKQLGERDLTGRVNADIIQLFFDTYNDKQNGFAFKIMASGVQGDDKLLNGGGDNGGSDRAWDAVWESKTRTDANGWYAELKIPFSAMRFPKTPIQTWGFNIQRRVRKLNETSFWNAIDVNKSGFLAQEGLLTGIQNIEPPVRLALFPYIGTGIQKIPNATATYPTSGGMDIKYGLNDAFTLDMTLVPDFNQVASDNLVRNTSPFEQQLTENRPFFTEGVELFNRQGLLYTRRIGARPTKFYAIEDTYGDTSKFAINKNPSISRLYNAFKISGRNNKKLGIGIFNAVQAPTFASIDNKLNNENIRVNTSNLVNYNLLVLDKALKGQSYINFTNASTLRWQENRQANVAGLQYVQFSKDENYSFTGNVTLSSIFLQDSISNGLYTKFNVGKTAGKLKYGAIFTTFGKNYDQTDLGIQFNYNHAEQTFGGSYDNNKPRNKRFIQRNVNLRVKTSENIYPFILKRINVEASSFYLFKNFVDVRVELESSPVGQNNFYSLASRGINFHTFGYTYAAIGGSSDSRKKWYTEFYAGRGTQHNNTSYTYTYMNMLFRYLFNDHFTASIGYEPTIDRANVDNTYITLANNAPLLAHRHINEHVLELNAKYTFTPNANINARFRHYNAQIKNKTLYTITQDGNYLDNVLPYTAAYDENYNLQNIDIFYNWIFRPGSRLVCSYKQWLNDAYVLNSMQENSFGRNITKIIKQPKAYAFSVRLIWYLDYNTIRNSKNQKP